MLKKAEVMQQQQVDHMMSEKDILTTLDHPFVVKMAATFQGARGAGTARGGAGRRPRVSGESAAVPGRRCSPPRRLPRPDERFLYMVLEFVIGGEFFTHLRRAGRLDNDTARFFAAQITSVFAHIHEQVRMSC